MCRNIKPLFNFDPPATDDEIRDAALQFVRKISGFDTTLEAQRGGVRPRRHGHRRRARDLLDSLETTQPRATARKKRPRRAPER